MVPVKTISVDIANRVATMTLRRPHVLNALDSHTHLAISAAFDEFERDDDVGAVVIAAEGRAFCSGSDLREIGQLTGRAEQEYVALDFRTKNKIATCPKPVIAAIQGYCVGGGLELALACDIRIAAEDAIFAMPEVTLGSLPGSGGLQRLPLVVGVGIAKEWILTGRHVDAEEARLRGLVNDVVPADSLRDTALAFARGLAAKSSLAMHLAKIALTPEPLADRGLVAAFQMLAGDATHSQPSYSSSTRRFAEHASDRDTGRSQER